MLDIMRQGASVLGHSSTKQRGGQIVYNSQGRPIGRILNGWLVKTGLDPAKHKLRQPEGWATDANHLELPIEGIRLTTTTGEVWEATIETWRQYGLPIDRGHGRQIVLPSRFWRVERAGVRQLTLFEVAA